MARMPAEGPEALARPGAPSGFKGHWQLGVRGCTSAVQATLTLLLVISRDDPTHNVILMLCQMTSSATLFNQWRTGNPWMFVARSIPSFVRCGLLLHLAVCGRRWFWDECDAAGWDDIRHAFRVVHVLAALRMLLNGLSLVLQFLLPQRGVTARHGNEQLFYRGCIRILGVPLHVARGVLKLVILRGTPFERSSLEVVVNFARCLPISVSSWSLLHQWRHTGVGPLIGGGALDVEGEELSQTSKPSTSEVMHVGEVRRPAFSATPRGTSGL